MIKAAGENNGVPVLILGLSARNRELLLSDRPIRIAPGEMVEMGLPEMELVVIGGATEEEILDQFRAAGVKIPDPIHDLPHSQAEARTEPEEP